MHVPPEVLATYVGTYEQFTVTLSGDQLFLDIGGKGKVPLYPLSQTTFSPRLLGTYEFVKNESGVVTHLIAYSTEGDVKAVRK